MFTLQQAQADLEVTSENLRKQFPDTHATVTVRVAPLLDSVVERMIPQPPERLPNDKRQNWIAAKENAKNAKRIATGRQDETRTAD